MLKIVLERLRQGHRTAKFPKQSPVLSDRFRGLPVIDPGKCKEGCRVCADNCPTDAIFLGGKQPKVDLGRCLFCMDCAQTCPSQAISCGQEYRLAGNTRQSLVVDGGPAVPAHAL